MGKRIDQTTKTYFEDDYSDDNVARCPGFHNVTIRGYSYPARCHQDHPHREMIKVEGTTRTRVPMFPWASNLKTQAGLEASTMGAPPQYRLRPSLHRQIPKPAPTTREFKQAAKDTNLLNFQPKEDPENWD